MNAVNLTVEVHCLKPSWVNYENNKYRLYVNDDLLTERTWIWELNTLINENIWIDVPANSTNTVRLELIIQDHLLAQFALLTQFALRNLQVVNASFTSEQINDLTISFTL